MRVLCTWVRPNCTFLIKENPSPNEEEIRHYLAGNLCRCSGYEGQLRAITKFVEAKK